MFSSNEKISGRQAFRLLVFDLLGLGTLLIPTAVAGFCGRERICGIHTEHVRYIFWKNHTGGISDLSGFVSRVYGVSVFCSCVKKSSAGRIFLSGSGFDPSTCVVWLVKRD